MNLRHHLLIFCMAFMACHGSESMALGQVGLDHIRFSSSNFLEIDQLFGTNPGMMQRAPAELQFEHVFSDTFNYLGNNGGFGANGFYGASLYFVEPGDLFSESNLESGLFPRLEETTSFFSVPYELPESFYIGIRTPIEGVFTTPYPIAYGWANISNSGGQLTLIDHAVSYSGIIFNDPDRSGIVVGVPEPATGALAFASSILFMLRRKKQEHWSTGRNQRES